MLGKWSIDAPYRWHVHRGPATHRGGPENRWAFEADFPLACWLLHCAVFHRTSSLRLSLGSICLEAVRQNRQGR